MKKASVPVTVNLNLLGPDNEIYTLVEENSEDKAAREVDADDFSDEETHIESIEGVLEWPVVVDQIVKKYSDRA